ncbi:MAG: sn-glycerol-3-phosphate ABC transporter ATP-binding protein UgpC [Clostridiaceae bacterium]
MRVDLQNIGKKYEGREEFTIRHINLEIDSQDFCVILGPSGCGKTTLLRMIAGLNSITEGDLLFDGRRVNEVPSKDRDIAMVFQSYALYPHMTVYDNMAFSLNMRHERKSVIDERVKEAARILDITKYLHSKPSDISGGQRQRVALGRAIVRKPQVFLMDEPLSNLDAKLREHMRVELVRIHKNLGTTTIYVTHDQTEAMTMANKIVLMNDGKIQQFGTPLQLYNLPANVFVAKFIGSPTMNIIEGTMEGGVFTGLNGKVKVTPKASDLEFLKNYEGKKVSMGIRPERIMYGGEIGDTFNAEVDVIETLGKEKLLYAKLDGGQDIIISVPGHLTYQPDKVYSFGYDLDALHFFNTETGERINITQGLLEMKRELLKTDPNAEKILANVDESAIRKAETIGNKAKEVHIKPVE